MAKPSRDHKLSFNDHVTKLEALKKKNQEFENGNRKTLYGFLQETTALALSLDADEDMRPRFRKKTGENDVLRGALFFVFNAESEPERKEASKRAIAIKYLIEKLKVSIEDIATAIPEHGGIEKLARAAAKPSKDEVNEEEDDDQDEPEEAGENDEPENNLGRQIQVGFSPKLTKILKGFVNKTRIKIIGRVRASADEPLTIEAKRIVEIKAKNKVSKKKIASSKPKKASTKQPESEHDWA
jgi:hypothetical protein